MPDTEEKLALAREHLERVLAAWDAPTDWTDLYVYGFYCLEAAVEAASIHFGIEISRNHWKKVEAAARLHNDYGLTDIEQLLVDLNTARKAAAYGDIEEPDLDAEEIASRIERYVLEVETVVEEEDDDDTE